MAHPAYFLKKGGYNQALQALWKMVEQDAIVLDGFRGTRRALAARLWSTHMNQLNANSQTNSAFLGKTISQADCEAGLTNPRGYKDKAGLAAWAGRHSGRWYVKGKTGKIWTDNAIWYAPRAEACKHGTGRRYDFQPVSFLGQGAHIGCNQSHRYMKAIWGWDPKPGLDEKRFAPHLGYTFASAGVECILWITPAEAFLECICPYTGKDQTGPVRRRTSAAVNHGIGQWAVS